MNLSLQGILDYVRQEFDLEEGEVAADTLLFSEGLLDSFHLVDLVRFLEKSSGLRVTPMETNLENLDTAERMLNFLTAKAARPG